MADDNGAALPHWRVRIDQRVCVGSATCVAMAPGQFVFDDEDRSRPVREISDPDDALLTAAEMCPTGALTVIDTLTGQEP
jgi:ferredoxin